MRPRRLVLLPIVSILFFCSAFAHAQLWSGILDPSRAVDWSQAGIPGGIPARTTQCGSTINAYSGSATTINNAIAACPAGQFVNLGAGTFNLTSGINFGTTNNVTLRGQGANSTFLVFSGTTSCNGLGTDACLAGSNSAVGSEQNVCDWTAGYSPGTTVITLANCGTTPPAHGSMANLHVGSIIILDQVDEASDTGTIWNCATPGSCANTIQGGYARNDGPTVSGIAIRSEQQGFVVTAINGSNITVSPQLYMPNWRSAQKPQAFFANSTATMDGVENLSMDHSGTGGYGAVLMNCYQCWISGIRSLVAGRDHVLLLGSSHSEVRQSYFYQSISHATVSYTIELNNSFDSLIESNISQQVTDSLPNNNGGAEGNVAAYNFAIDDVYGSTGWMQASYYQHASGDAFNLWEGNIGPGYTADDVHGTHHFETLFRNYLIGNQAAGCGGAGLNTCTAQTIPIHIYASSRYMNIVGNVLGQSGYHNNYQCVGTAASPNCSGNQSIYVMGYTGNGGNQDTSITGFCLQPSCTSHGDVDPQTGVYSMRWGNYDTVNNAVRFVNSEVPSTVNPYGNAVPASQNLPTSCYLNTKPAWFGSTAWPPIGPDVTSGNISNVSGHANMNPAMACYLNVMGGPANGTGGALPFNADSCYGAGDPPPASPTGLSAVVH